MSERRTWLALVLVLVLGLILAFYYWVHKPLGPPQALALAQTAFSAGIAALTVWLAGGLGRRGLRWAGVAGLAPGEQAAVSVALGLGLLGLLMLGLGLARAYHWAVAWALAAGGLVVLRGDAAAWWAEVRAEVRALRPAGRAEWLALGFVGLMLAQGLLRALAPPLMWDALVYHLTLPARYVQAGGLWLAQADFSLFTGMPQASEMLYAFAILLHGSAAEGGLIAAQTLGWAIGALAVLGLAALARRLGVSGVWAAAVLLSAHSIALSLAWAYADLLPMLCAAAMLMALYAWRERPERRWLVLAGVLGGLAWGSKYTGVIVPLAGAALASGLALERGGRGNWLRALGPGAAVGLAALAVFLPWLLKNWLLFGSPVYPLGWPAADMDAARQWFFSRPDLAPRGLEALLVFPRAVFLGVQGANAFDATLGPLWVALPLLLAAGWPWLEREARRRVWPVIVFTASAYAAWVVLAHFSALGRQPRLFLAVLPALACLGAAGLAAARGLDSRSLRLSWVVRVLGLVILALGATETMSDFVRQNPLSYVLTAEAASDYRAARLGWYEVAFRQLQPLPPGARVMLLWEPRSLHCPAQVTCVPDVAIDHWWHLRRTLESNPAILDGWRAAGVTHVLIHEAGANFAAAEPESPFEAGDWAALAALRDGLTWVSAAGPAYTLYALP